MSDIFRTSVLVEESKELIDYADSMMFVGSCFAENIGSRFKERLYNAMVNPFGVVYNPASVSATLIDIINEELFTDEDVLLHNGLWHSFRLHGSFSSTIKADVIDLANLSLEEARQHLRHTKNLIITFGTAWIYSLKETNRVVANCHKHPSNAFVRTILTVDEIVELWQTTIEKLRQFNPSIKITFTVSPVRHWKDGAHGNQISKSTLLLAIDRLMSQDKALGYFPAYEIMMDELRDYRFYADDMLHPSNLAQNYIFDSFCIAYLTPKAQEFGKESSRLVAALNHRPIQPETEGYRQFINNTIMKIKALQAKYPLIDANILLKEVK